MLLATWEGITTMKRENMKRNITNSSFVTFSRIPFKEHNILAVLSSD